MNKIKVQFIGLSQVVAASHMGLLVLADEAKTRQVAIVCDGMIEREFIRRMKNDKLNERLLPEVMCTVNPLMTGEHYEVFFNTIREGQYRAMLLCKDDFSLTPIRASDAVLLAQVAKLDMYMEEHLFKMQSAPYHKNEGKMSLPINALTDQMLLEALSKAIEEENYELASIIHEEIGKRENKNKEQDNTL